MRPFAVLPLFARRAVSPIVLSVLALAAGCQGSTAPADSAAPGDLAQGADAAAPPAIRPVLNTDYLPTLNALLDGAQTSIWGVHFELNRDADGDAIVAKLAAAAKRGVAVHLTLESSVASNPVRVQELTAAGVMAKLADPSRYTHAKLVTVDGAHALFGSTNWSFESMERNNESSLLVDDAQAVGWYEQYAKAIFADSAATPALAPLDTAVGTTLEEGDYVPRAGALIDGATKRVQLVLYGMNADPKYPDSDVLALIKKLASASARGVDVRVVLETSQPDLGVNAVNLQAATTLHAAGVPVRFDTPQVITHAKILVGDGEALLGSNNWGYGGFHLYHEVGMHTRVPEVVGALSAYCDRIWAAGTPAP